MSSSKAGSSKIAGVLKSWFAPLATSKFWLQTVHLLLDLPVGVIGFIIALDIPLLNIATGTNHTLLNITTATDVGINQFSNGRGFQFISYGLTVILISIPLLAATVLIGRLFATFQRKRAQKFLGDNPPAPEKFKFTGSPWLILQAALKDIEGWKGLLYGVIALPLGIVNFTIAVVLWCLAISLTLIFTYFWAFLSSPMFHFGFPWMTNAGHLYRVSGWATFGWELGLTIIGLILLGLTPRIINGLAKFDQLLIRSLCSPSPQGLLNQRVNALEESRSASVQSAASELRRIERDLHDGAQQHLVSVAMQLGMVKDRLNNESDPETVELITSAHKDAKQAIVELRDLVRGIHPSVLTDRGLDAAISALAGRCPIPVDIQNEVTDRLPQAVEATAYFVVAETLTNIAKHSQAAHATVRLSKEMNRIVIEVTDDGIGGARDDTDGGLRGLRDRVRSIEGDMTISSPANGPTTIIVNLPCE